jgi:hypothetical protein
MNKNDVIFEKRRLGEIGLDLYFYNLRTLMIYNYEIIYQLTDGVWSSYRYPRGHSDPWVSANLHLTQGKSNARNVVEIGCNILKNDYDLKRILNTATSYSRVKSIGKLVMALDDDVDLITTLLNEDFHELSSYIEQEFNEENFNEFMGILESNGRVHSLQVFSEDIMKKYIESDYTDKVMRDDLGMIQNTMRNTTSLHY